MAHLITALWNLLAHLNKERNPILSPLILFPPTVIWEVKQSWHRKSPPSIFFFKPINALILCSFASFSHNLFLENCKHLSTAACKISSAITLQIQLEQFPPLFENKLHLCRIRLSHLKLHHQLQL